MLGECKERQTGCDGQKVKMSSEGGTQEAAASPTSGRPRRIPGERKKERGTEKSMSQK